MCQIVDRLHHRLLVFVLVKVTNGTQVRHELSHLVRTQINLLPELFLPSHMECDFESLDRRREPVVEITLTDEEINNLLPQ